MTTTRPIRLLIHGARGRMGARISALAATDQRFSVVGAHDFDDRDAAQRHAPGSVDVMIDFSSDSGAREAGQLAQRLNAALLVGTTGLSMDTRAALDEASRRVAVLIAANTSRGVAVLNHLIAKAARLLGPDYHIDLIESHHAAKNDAPSGTALRMITALKDHGVDVPADRIHCIRAGDIIGEHMLQFSGPGERVQLAHIATSRDVFAIGALAAAAWLAGRPPGRYSIEQSLGLNDG
jgi:4-hydroxy-tetrahydrodipicolinate reductase